MPRVTVVGLGPAGPELMTAASLAALDRAAVTFLRTSRHPAASVAVGARTFDDLYDSARSLEEVYRGIVEALVGAAMTHDVVYAVPGSPAVAERSVELLRLDPRIEVDVVPALSCVDLVWSRLGVDPLSLSPRIIDGQRFAVDAAGQRGPLLVLQCDRRQVLSDIKLAIDNAPPVTLLHHLGLPDESIVTVAWSELDRAVEPDHLTSLWIPLLDAPVAAELVRFEELVRTLRHECPWDREQTHATLTRHLLEETYELLEAIEGLHGDTGWEHLEEELGDLLFQVFFHSVLAAEEGRFTLADVARGIHDKLVHRHPHVFGAVDAPTADAVVTNWEQIKREEKGRASLMDGIPGDLPSLLYAHKVQRKAASVGFDWDSAAGAYPKVAEELDEVQRAGPDDVAGEVGDLLFACVNVARHRSVDPESALRGATAKFRRRFMEVERLAAQRDVDLVGADLATLDRLWDEVKARAGSAGADLA